MIDEKKYREVRAQAKINLSLDVVGKRSDGYHLVRMVMQTLELHDSLFFERSDDAGIYLETDCPDLPADGSNLIVRAAESLLKEYAPGKGVRIVLRKRIPLAAGLAGGSTDAAAALRGLNELFSLGLGEGELCRIGSGIGADVPFCICGGTALSEGIGEILTPLSPLPACTILLARPEIAVSTPEIYSRFDHETGVDHPDTEAQIQALQNGDLDGVAAQMKNVLEPVTAGLHPVVAAIREAILEGGACGARMSGSGPTVFGLFRERVQAEAAGRLLRERDLAKDIMLTEPAQ